MHYLSITYIHNIIQTAAAAAAAAVGMPASNTPPAVEFGRLRWAGLSRA
jgi:hypothetical protein